MEALGELRAERVDGDLVGGDALLRPAVLELAAHLMAVRDGVGIRVELICQPRLLECREVPGFRRGRWAATRLQQYPGDHRDHDDDGRYRARSEPCQADARPGGGQLDIVRQ